MVQVCDRDLASIGSLLSIAVRGAQCNCSAMSSHHEGQERYQKVEEQGKGLESWKLMKSSSPMLFVICCEQKKKTESFHLCCAPTLVGEML